MQTFGITDTGKTRTNNQDSILLNDDLGIYIVADGMGGHAFGDMASDMAVNVINDFLVEGLLNAEAKTLREDAAIHELLKQAVAKANADILSYSKSISEKNTMGTTVSLLLFKNGKAHIAHVGDSRIYRFRKGKLEKLTTDHNEAQYLVDIGSITGEDAENHHLSHILTRVLGVTGQMLPDMAMHPVKRADSFLLCSDGLFRVLDMNAVQEIMAHGATPREKCRALIDKSLENDAPDNVSVIVAETGKKGWLRYLRRFSL